jgi:hypothetical protein
MGLFLGFLLVVTLSFGTVSAVFHAAPAPAVVAAGVDKHIPTSAIISTFSYPYDLLRGDQVGCLPYKGPENPVRRIFSLLPRPGKSLIGRGDLAFS